MFNELAKIKIGENKGQVHNLVISRKEVPEQETKYSLTKQLVVEDYNNTGKEQAIFLKNSIELDFDSLQALKIALLDIVEAETDDLE